jgi:hypothetical protein
MNNNNKMPFFDKIAWWIEISLWTIVGWFTASLCIIADFFRKKNK